MSSTDFIWHRDDQLPGQTPQAMPTVENQAAAVLRPDTDPVYQRSGRTIPTRWIWQTRFRKALPLPTLLRKALPLPTLRAVASQWAPLARLTAMGGIPLDLELMRRTPLPQFLTTERLILYSLGTYDRPNHWEAEAARDLMENLMEHRRHHPDQRQPLLILPGTAQPVRRLLHGLMRNAPSEAPRFVVATGDGIPFNTVYRDRQSAWPIQDLPFRLVFFCHRNPVDAEVGFQEVRDIQAADTAGERSPTMSGTEDFLLYVDIVETLVQASFLDRSGELRSSMPASGKEMKEKLQDAQLKAGRICFHPDGRQLFDAEGNRRGGTGEHVVCVRPRIEGGRIQPESIIEVWSRSLVDSSGYGWQHDRTLRASYESD